MVITIFGSVTASSGFWAFIMKRQDRNDATTKLVLGLTRNEIVTQGLAFIERGYIYKDEFDDYVKYLYAPYSTFGGNGLAEKVFNEVSSLPIRPYMKDDDIEKTPKKYTVSKEDKE